MLNDHPKSAKYQIVTTHDELAEEGDECWVGQVCLAANADVILWTCFDFTEIGVIQQAEGWIESDLQPLNS